MADVISAAKQANAHIRALAKTEQVISRRLLAGDLTAISDLNKLVVALSLCTSFYNGKQAKAN